MLLEIPFPNIDPIAVRLGPVAIHWYAIMYLLAFAIGYALMRVKLRQEPYRSITRPSPWTKTDVEDVLLGIIIGVLVGGRIGYVLFYQPNIVLSDPLRLFAIWEGGMSFHGGLIGVMLALVVFAWRKKRPWLQVTDLMTPAAPIGLAAGRIGNFINGELWGRPAPESLPWGMRFPTGGDVLRHPSQLYQALGEGLLLFVLLWFYSRKPRARGQVSGAFLFGYGVFRFAAEYFREPDSFLGLLGLGLSMGQWLSVPMIIGGAALWIWARMRGTYDAEVSTDAQSPVTPTEKAEEDTSEPVQTDSDEASTSDDS